MSRTRQSLVPVRKESVMETMTLTALDITAMVREAITEVMPEIITEVKAAIQTEVLTSVEPTAPASPKASPKAKGSPKVKFLTRKAREAFIRAALKDGWDYSGMSAKDIARDCVESGYCPKGWVIGDGYRALFS